ncbi:hypothetical protein IC582_023728 [Cucumis melo]
MLDIFEWRNVLYPAPVFWFFMFWFRLVECKSLDGVSYAIFNSGKYVVFNGILQFIVYTKEKNAILFTYPPAGSFTSTGLIVSSKLPRFSDLYTLTISSSDPKSISANEPVQFTKSVTRWFTKDGVLVEGLFWKDVEALIDEYAREPKKSK